MSHFLNVRRTFGHFSFYNISLEVPKPEVSS